MVVQMSDRRILGAADVSDAELAGIVAGWLGESPDDIEVVHSHAEIVPYDLAAITTAGRYWGRGEAQTPTSTRPFSFFVKHVQSWSRSPLFAAIPPDFRESAEASVPWRTEPLIYRSDLRDRLPAGLTMPRAVAVRDLDEKSAAVWLEEVPIVSRVWTERHLARADDLVLIDFGFWMPEPFGFDLGQLLLGDVQLGRSPAAELNRNERACTSAY